MPREQRGGAPGICSARRAARTRKRAGRRDFAAFRAQEWEIAAPSWSARRKNRPEGVRERMALVLPEQVHHASASPYRTPQWNSLFRSTSSTPGFDWAPCYLDRLRKGSIWNVSAQSCPRSRPRSRPPRTGQRRHPEGEETLFGKKTLTKSITLQAFASLRPSRIRSRQQYGASDGARGGASTQRATTAPGARGAAGDSGGRERLRGGHSRQGHARCKRAGADGEPVAPPRGTDPETHAGAKNGDGGQAVQDRYVSRRHRHVTGLWLALGFKF